jgi:hypothetical protein
VRKCHRSRETLVVLVAQVDRVRFHNCSGSFCTDLVGLTEEVSKAANDLHHRRETGALASSLESPCGINPFLYRLEVTGHPFLSGL